MKDEKEHKETSITFRTSEELKSRLLAMAMQESRTLSNMIEVLLEKAIETSKNKK